MNGGIDMRTALLTLALLSTTVGMASAATASLQVEVEGIQQDNAIPETFALCKPTTDGKSTAGTNQRPTLRWSGAPEDTKSFAVIVKDPDVPADFADADKEGKTVAKDAPRQLFYHWAVTGIPASQTELKGGDAKTPPRLGTQHVNSLGTYVPTPAQYGGPCPPWNDARTHRYHFTVYALDKDFRVKKEASAADVEKQLQDHVLASGTVTGSYSLNAALKP
ncbi:MAG: phospholipid-binding protein [Azospirillum brasilense]|nr:MAG: phospholipid-binding protein [Azospirillum brasilense]